MKRVVSANLYVCNFIFRRDMVAQSCHFYNVEIELRHILVLDTRLATFI